MANKLELDEREMIELYRYCENIIEEFGVPYIEELNSNPEFKSDVKTTLNMIKKSCF